MNQLRIPFSEFYEKEGNKDYVPFVSEVEEFKILRGKINDTVSATVWDTYSTFTNNILNKAKDYIKGHNLS